MIRDLIYSVDLKGLEAALRKNPSLAGEEIPLADNPAKAHPLHRVCDGVWNRNYSEEDGIQLATILLDHGSDLNSVQTQGKDSPLTAACSLHCDELALLFIDRGANIHHQGCHGGTALHWAAWCGRDVIVKKLVPLTKDINRLCIDFKSTPLFWAIHGYTFGGKDNLNQQVGCARVLLAHGADPTIPNFEGKLPRQIIKDDDSEMRSLFI